MSTINIVLHRLSSTSAHILQIKYLPFHQIILAFQISASLVSSWFPVFLKFKFFGCALNRVSTLLYYLMQSVVVSFPLDRFVCAARYIYSPLDGNTSLLLDSSGGQPPTYFTSVSLYFLFFNPSVSPSLVCLDFLTPASFNLWFLLRIQSG